MLHAAQQLRAVQMRDALRADEPDMCLGARDPCAEVQREAVIGAALGDLGIQRGEMERRQRLVLQADMRQRGVRRHLHLEDRIVQIAAVADRQFQQRQARTGRQVDRVARMEGGPIGRDADQQQQPGIDAGRHGQDRAVLRQHRVQRDQRLAVGARQRAELGAIGEAARIRRAGGSADSSGRNSAIDEDDARRIDTRQAGEQRAVAGERRQRLHGMPRRRPGAGWCISRPPRDGPMLAPGKPARRNASRSAAVALPRITGQALAQRRR